MRVEQAMTKRVWTCRPFDSLRQAAQLMVREDVGCLPVVASDESQRVIGMLTDRDVVMAAARGERSLAEIDVRAAMSGSARCCWPDDALLDALELMRGRRLRRLPVVDRSGQIQGLISLSDIAREAARDAEVGPVLSRLRVCATFALSARAQPRAGAPTRARAGEGSRLRGAGRDDSGSPELAMWMA